MDKKHLIRSLEMTKIDLKELVHRENMLKNKIADLEKEIEQVKE